MTDHFSNRATSKQLWKLNDLAYQRAILVNSIESLGGEVDIPPMLSIPMPLFKEAANNLIKVEIEKIGLLEEMKQLLLVEAK